jgi:glycosyltransferase involved in cell wall biosynthesis
MIICGSLTHNDKSKGWLNAWLDNNSKYVDKWVILDDFSDDGTYEELVARQKADNKFVVAQTTEPTFTKNENQLRAMLWAMLRGVANEGDYILILDSDEQLTPEFKKIPSLIEKYPMCLYSFKKYEMWDEDCYRVDGLWSNYFERMFPFQNLAWPLTNEGFHYPAVPLYALNLPRFNTDVGIKHLAYSSPMLRKKKYDFMINNSQQAKDINYYHLLTTLDFDNAKENVRLVRYSDDEIKELPRIMLIYVASNLYKPHEQMVDFLKQSYDFDVKF